MFAHVCPLSFSVFDATCFSPVQRLAFSSLHLQKTSPFPHYALSYLIYIFLSYSLLTLRRCFLDSVITIWLPATSSMYILHALCLHVCCPLLLNPDIVLWSSFDPMTTSLSLCLTALLSLYPIMSLSDPIGNVGQVSSPSLYF